MVNLDRYRIYNSLYGQEGYARIANARVLIVGAGGIGCEVSYLFGESVCEECMNYVHTMKRNST